MSNRPISSEYYIGIGIANYTGNIEDDLRRATENAQNDLAAALRIQIESTTESIGTESRDISTDIMIVGVEDDVTAPADFSLGQNYPNPFNPSTRITYSLAVQSNVSLKVYDILGNEVVTLVNTTQGTGVYEVNFNASNLASGLYFYTLKAGSFTSTKKMMLLK